MPSSYDTTIREHYDRIAAKHGLSSASTMEDAHIRAAETAAIDGFVAFVAARFTRPLTIVDVGCGNGFTLAHLAAQNSRNRHIGIEQNARLLALAKEQTKAQPSVSIRKGDIRKSLPRLQADLVICQRVLINILEPKDQRAALANIAALAKPGGFLMFVEAFQQGLDNLNEARAELGLAPLPPAHHNRYLASGIFRSAGLREFHDAGLMPRNHLSTHFYVSRLMHEVARGIANTPFRHNSHFVGFWTAALPPGIGDYAQVQFRYFRKA